MRLLRLSGHQPGSVLKTPNLTLTVLTASLLSSKTPVFAQHLALEEVIVSATKKKEVLQDIPFTVNVLTGKKIQDYNLFNFQEIQALTPGLSLNTVDPRNFSISLRGVPFDPGSAAAESVVTYFNGMSVRSNVAFSQFYDIERLEILRGPQGTLQGETSPSGSIQIYTRKAKLNEREARLQQVYDDNNGNITNVSINVPVINNKLSMRVAGIYSTDGQYNLYSASNGLSASTNSESGRINIHWIPKENVQTSLTVQYLERSTDGIEGVEGQDRLSGTDPDLKSFDRTSLQDGASDVIRRNQLATFLVDFTLDNHTLSTVTGYQNNLASANRDLDIGNIFPNANRNQMVNSQFEIITQEIRISNDAANSWEYIGGLYYNDRNSLTINDNITFNGFSYNPDLGHLYSTPVSGSPLAAPLGFGDPELLALYTKSFIPINTETLSAFLDNTFFINEKTTLQIGVRFQKKRSFQSIKTYSTSQFRVPTSQGSPFTSVALFQAGEFLGSGIPLNRQSDTVYAWTGSIKLSHHISEGLTIYSSIGRGFRPGSVTISPTPSITAESTLLLYDEEESNSAEIGFKSIIDSGRYQINGSIYYQKIDNFINRATNLFIANTPGGILNIPVLGGINYNADAIVRGIEIESNALLSENWRVFIGLSYNDAKFSNAMVPCGNPGERADSDSQIKTCSSSGRLGPEPNWSVSASTEYTPPNRVFGAQAYIRALYKFTDKRSDDFASVNPFIYESYSLDSYSVVDVYMGFRAADKSWDIGLFSKNLFDEKAITDIGPQEIHAGVNLAGGPGLLESGYSTVSVIPERTIGISGVFRFGDP